MGLRRSPLHPSIIALKDSKITGIAVGGKRDEKTFISSIPLIFYACW